MRCLMSDSVAFRDGDHKGPLSDLRLKTLFPVDDNPDLRVIVVICFYTKSSISYFRFIFNASIQKDEKYTLNKTRILDLLNFDCQLEKVKNTFYINL